MVITSVYKKHILQCILRVKQLIRNLMKSEYIIFLSQDINPRTGTRLDCPRPNKWKVEDGGDYHCTSSLDPNQMSPRFISRQKNNRVDTSPGNIIIINQFTIIQCHVFSLLNTKAFNKIIH